MRRWLLGMALVATVAPAAAATWSCDERHEVLGKTFVLARCVAHGTYTTGGDPIGAANPGVDLCNSENRIPVGSIFTAAESGTTGQGYLITYGRTTGRVYFLTAGNAPGPGTALVELTGGTSVEGATIMVLTLCK